MGNAVSAMRSMTKKWRNAAEKVGGQHKINGEADLHARRRAGGKVAGEWRLPGGEGNP